MIDDGDAIKWTSVRSATMASKYHSIHGGCPKKFLIETSFLSITTFDQKHLSHSFSDWHIFNKDIKILYIRRLHSFCVQSRWFL